MSASASPGQFQRSSRPQRRRQKHAVFLDHAPLRDTTGTIRIFGFDVSRAPCEALRRLGVVFQARTLDLDLTVKQNLSYHAALHGIAGQETKLRAGFVLAQVEMAGSRA